MPLCDASNPGSFFFRNKTVAQPGGGQLNQDKLHVPNIAAPLSPVWHRCLVSQSLDSRFSWLQLGLKITLRTLRGRSIIQEQVSSGCLSAGAGIILLEITLGGAGSALPPTSWETQVSSNSSGLTCPLHSGRRVVLTQACIAEISYVGVLSNLIHFKDYLTYFQQIIFVII